MKRTWEKKAVKGDIMRLPNNVRLDWVPGYEGVLQFCPSDLKFDREPRLYSVYKWMGHTIRSRLKPMLTKPKNQNRRLIIMSKAKNSKICMQYSHMIELCKTGFAIADNTQYVVDHIDGNPINNRPSNLRVISQKENLNTHTVNMLNMLKNSEKKTYNTARMHFIKETRERLRKEHPKKNSVQIELILNERLIVWKEGYIRNKLQEKGKWHKYLHAMNSR